ncbi:MAG: hypothetical protein AAF478_12940, partial [Pseudomonadota bacterium]
PKRVSQASKVRASSIQSACLEHPKCVPRASQVRASSIPSACLEARNKGITALHAANISYSTFAKIGTDGKKLPWVTIDRSYSHLPEAKLPEEHSGEVGIRFTATATTSIQNIITSGSAKGLLPNFVGEHGDLLARVPDHPTVTRPLWIMWRDGALELPHFRSTISWILDTAKDVMELTDEAALFQAEHRSNLE